MTRRTRNTSIDTVYGFWYRDGSYNFTTQAPLDGPNGGVIRGRTATLKAGPVTVDTASHSWRVLVQFYRGVRTNSRWTPQPTQPARSSAEPARAIADAWRPRAAPNQAALGGRT